MAEQEKNCFLGIKGKKHGPMTEQEVKTLYAQKKINGYTKFFRAGEAAWITVAESGIITATEPVDDDGVPPLPPEDNTTPSNSSNNKSKLGYIAVGLGAAVLISFVCLIVILTNLYIQHVAPVNSGTVQTDSTKEPDNNNTAQNNSTENLSETTAAEATPDSVEADETVSADDNTEEYSTFHEQNFGIEFDYPSRFTYERTDKDDTNNLVIYNFVDPDYKDEDSFVMIVSFDTGKFWRDLSSDLAAIDYEYSSEYSLDLEKSIANYKNNYESFELLDTFESTNSIMFCYRGLEKNFEPFSYTPYPTFDCIYINYGDYSTPLGVITVNMTFSVPVEYEDEYKDTVQSIIDSLRDADIKWMDAEALIPSEYKEGSLSYHPAYNIEDDDGGIMFYGFKFYKPDIYGELWVNPVTEEVKVDSREMPKTDESAETVEEGIIGEWIMQENGWIYHLTIGADGSYNRTMSSEYDSGGAIDMGTYEIVSESVMRITLDKIEDYTYEADYRLDGDALYFDDNVTSYHRYVKPIDPNILLNEKYESTPLSPLYGNNTYIPEIIFNEARAYILDGDDYILTRDPNYGWTYAKSRYDVAVTLLEQQGYKDTPLYELALSRWMEAYYKETQQ